MARDPTELKRRQGPRKGLHSTDHSHAAGDRLEARKNGANKRLVSPWSYDHESSGGDGLISILNTGGADAMTAEDLQADFIMQDVKLVS